MLESEIFKLASIWASNLERNLKRSIRLKKVKDTDSLLRGLRTEVEASGDSVVVNTIFKTYGRFVDMGTGRATSTGIESAETNRLFLTGRKPKKWYSPVFFGSIYNLYGAIGAKVAEQILTEQKQAFKNGNL